MVGRLLGAIRPGGTESKSMWMGSLLKNLCFLFSKPTTPMREGVGLEFLEIRLHRTHHTCEREITVRKSVEVIRGNRK